MRRLENEKNIVICNRCKKVLKSDKDFLKEGVFSADYAFGYFSRKDGTRHRFDLCEDCYDEIIGSFEIPVDVIEETELV